MSGSIDPERWQFDAFKELPRDQPIQMLNLIELNDTAHYADGTMVTGREAYNAYGRESAPIFAKVGGEIIWSGDFDLVLIGPPNEKWDVCFIAQYPDANAFFAMILDEQYQKIVHHRQAAVKDSRLIRMSVRDTGKGFG